MICELYKFYEERSVDGEKQSVDSLVASAPPASQPGLEKKLPEATKLWKKIAIIRHNVLAHTNLDLEKATVFKKANTTYDEVKQLIDLSKEILSAFCDVSDNIPSRIQTETYAILDILRSQLAQH